MIKTVILSALLFVGLPGATSDTGCTACKQPKVLRNIVSNVVEAKPVQQVVDVATAPVKVVASTVKRVGTCVSKRPRLFRRFR